MVEYEPWMMPSGRHDSETECLNGEWQEMCCAHETPSGFRAPTTISPIRLRLLGEVVAHLAQGYAPRPHRTGENNGKT